VVALTPSETILDCGKPTTGCAWSVLLVDDLASADGHWGRAGDDLAHISMPAVNWTTSIMVVTASETIWCSSTASVSCCSTPTYSIRPSCLLPFTSLTKWASTTRWFTMTWTSTTVWTRKVLEAEDAYLPPVPAL